MLQHSLFHEILKWAEISATFGSIIAVIYRYGKRAVDWLLAPRRTILTLATNHFPHMEETLKGHTEALVAMQSDFRALDTKVSGYSQRLDDTKQAVDNLHDAFIQHLENSGGNHGIG